MSLYASPGPVECRRCGMAWPRDPALEVPCPRCAAAIGRKCRRPSQHGAFGGEPHAERDRAAMDSGLLVKCPGGRTIRGTISSETVNDEQSLMPMEAA